jgi:hypothetical protein
MKFRPSLTIGLVCAVFGATAADADSKGPVLVIPGRPGIPVVINGYDASYTIVEGDWGLARPGQVAPVITNGPLITPAPYYTGRYYPHLGERPGYGRREYDPPENRRPRPAPSFYREWGAESQQLPADVNPPANQTPMVIEPNVGWDPRRHRHRRPPRHR